MATDNTLLPHLGGSPPWSHWHKWRCVGGTNCGVLGVSVCHISFCFFFLVKNGEEEREDEISTCHYKVFLKAKS
jgi:hypothetical protein